MDFLEFGVYQSVDVDMKPLVNVLSKGVFGDKDQADMWRLQPRRFTGQRITSIITHHQATAQQQALNGTFFVVVDREDWQEEGLLVININFQGSVDAIREAVNVAGDSIPSLSIANTTWFENLCNGELPLFPRKLFATYVVENAREDVKMADVLSKVNGGLRGRKAGSDMRGGICVGLNYTASSEDILKRHKEASAKEGYHSTMFIIVKDAGWEREGVVLVHIKGAQEPNEYTLEAGTVGELLQWIYVGLTSLVEIEAKSNYKTGEIGPSLLFLGNE
ncbi:MAG: hypothetical protein M1827_002204 [Pycnora praestabilis]|nr:MAG: hypothetical protein M1827_002204 [Pycnora praestabilis]